MSNAGIEGMAIVATSNSGSFIAGMSRGTSAYAFMTSAGEIVSMARFSRMFSILSSIHPHRPAAGSTP